MLILDPDFRRWEFSMRNHQPEERNIACFTVAETSSPSPSTEQTDTEPSDTGTGHGIGTMSALYEYISQDGSMFIEFHRTVCLDGKPSISSSRHRMLEILDSIPSCKREETVSFN